jgi:Flp pilus assembly protein TadG
MKILKRRRGSAGNTLVEMALSILLFFALVFGMTDIAMAVFLRSLFQHAAREGARFAITFSSTYQGTACATQTACIKKVVQDNALGFLTGARGSYIAVKYYAPNNLTTPVTAAGLPITLANGTVVNYVNQMGNVIEVSVNNYPWTWMVPILNAFISKGVNISVASSDVLQNYPVGQTAPPTP